MTKNSRSRGQPDCKSYAWTIEFAQARHRPMTIRTLGLLVLLLALGGCSGMRIVDTDVDAFSTAQSITLPARFRFERLPSQQAMADRQARLERLVQDGLEQVGLIRDDAAAIYSVSFEVRTAQDPRAPWEDPREDFGHVRSFIGIHLGRGVFVQQGFGLPVNSPYYRREVHLLVRRLSDGSVVFETRARHDGRWSDDEPVLRAMVEAALRDFPNPPQGMRRVDIEIPR